MNDDPAKFDTAVRSADQRAVIDYLASETYAHRQQYFGTPPTSAQDFGLLTSLTPFSGVASFWMGLVGLCTLVMILGAWMPAGMEATEKLFQTRPNFITMVIVMHSIAMPPIVAFSFAAVASMFWYGSVVVRFLVGILCVTPGCIAFCIGFEFFEHGTPPDFLQAFTAVMFAQFLAAGTVALIVQMWSRWTLSHARDAATPLPPPGTRAMMELTFVAAIGYAVFMSVDKFGIMEGLLFFTVAGLITSLAVVAVLIAFLRERQRNRAAALIAGLAAFACAFLFTGFVAVAEFGWDSILNDLLIISGLSLYGGALMCGVMWLCIWWLRVCGWRCVCRVEEKHETAETDARLGSV